MTDYVSKLSQSSVLSINNNPESKSRENKRKYIEILRSRNGGSLANHRRLQHSLYQSTQQLQRESPRRPLQPLNPVSHQSILQQSRSPSQLQVNNKISLSEKLNPPNDHLGLDSRSDSIEWIKQFSFATAKAVSSTVQFFGIGLYNLTKNILSSEFGDLEGIEESQEEGESPRKKRKLEMTDVIDLTEDDGEEIVRESMPGSLPFELEDLSMSNDSQLSNHTPTTTTEVEKNQHTLDNSTTTIKPINSTTTEIEKIQHIVDNSTTTIKSITSTIAPPEMKSISHQPQFALKSEPLNTHNLLKSTLTKSSIHIPTSKSSGGLFTPTMNRENPRHLELSDRPIQSNSPLYSSRRLFENIKQPIFENQNSSLAHSHVQSPIIPNVTYGTGFFMNRHKQQSPNNKIMENQSSQQSYELLAMRLKEVYKGSSYSVPIHSSPIKVQTLVPPSPVPATAIGTISYKDPNVLYKIQQKRDYALKHNTITAHTATKPSSPPITFPSKLSAEKTKKYDEIHKSRELLQKQIENLRLTEDDGFKKPLDPKQLALVEDYWYNKRYNPHDIIGTAYRVDLLVEDIRALYPRRWLNDNIIDFYLSMTIEKSNKNSKFKSFAFSTHFFSKLDSHGYKGVQAWAKRKKIDVTALDFVFVPMNLNNSHWVLAVINNKDQSFQFYDSMGGNGSRFLAPLCDYMIGEADRLKPGNHEQHYKKYTNYKKSPTCPCPQQNNGYDCGVFTCKNAEFISNGKRLLYNQSDIGLVRQKMAYDCITRAKEE